MKAESVIRLVYLYLFLALAILLTAWGARETIVTLVRDQVGGFEQSPVYPLASTPIEGQMTPDGISSQEISEYNMASEVFYAKQEGILAAESYAKGLSAFIIGLIVMAMSHQSIKRMDS